jgi:hypothetical protein
MFVKKINDRLYICRKRGLSKTPNIINNKNAYCYTYLVRNASKRNYGHYQFANRTLVLPKELVGKRIHIIIEEAKE